MHVLSYPCCSFPDTRKPYRCEAAPGLRWIPHLHCLCSEATKLAIEAIHLILHSLLCPDQFCSWTWFIHSSAYCRRHRPSKTRVSGPEQKNYHWHWEHLDKGNPLQTNAKSVATKIRSLKSTCCLQGDVLDGKGQKTPSYLAFLSKPKIWMRGHEPLTSYNYNAERKVSNQVWTFVFPHRLVNYACVCI